MQVRHIAIARARPVAALAAFESQVAIWDLQTLRRTIEFETVLDFGGRRLALSSDGSCCIAGAYNRDGVAAYDTNTGRVLWSRRDLKKVQYVSFSAAFAGFGRVNSTRRSSTTAFNQCCVRVLIARPSGLDARRLRFSTSHLGRTRCVRARVAALYGALMSAVMNCGAHRCEMMSTC